MIDTRKTFRISNETLQKLEVIKESGYFRSLSEVVNFILSKFINENSDLSFLSFDTIIKNSKKPKKLISEKINEIKIYINDDEKNKLKELAKKNGFGSVNRIATLIVINNLYDKEILDKPTLDEFARLNNQVKRVANLANQFARAINQDSSAYFSKEQIEKLCDEIKNNTTEVSKFIMQQRKILEQKTK